MSVIGKSGMPFTHTVTKKQILRGKRAFDIVVAGSMLMLLAPLFLFLAAIILITDGAPAFYSQERLGLHGEPFTMYKFRTMLRCAERDTGPTWARVEDERVTAVGVWLRRTRLDELPQLINVLRGDMSLVGPRPERKIFAEAFSREIPAFPLRLNVKPGITGLAQISGGYELSPLAKLQYDLIYISSMSWGMEFLIMWTTIQVMLSGHGAR